ncbi:MAG: hypothetical protein IPI67_26835 [Myxococcales bacterium]|nr:hypothetical protein [Myxococcales bacterium]
MNADTLGGPSGRRGAIVLMLASSMRMHHLPLPAADLDPMWSTQAQFSADQLDQLDLALDQLALRDRNFSRFGLMLVDNVVELALHSHARTIAAENQRRWDRNKPPEVDLKVVSRAQGQHFVDKVKLAEITKLLDSDEAESIRILHEFRNSAHHAGHRHEGILHSIALFYFGLACAIMTRARGPSHWSSSSADEVPHRAKKHLGVGRGITAAPTREDFAQVWVRLRGVADDMSDGLIKSLGADMERTIDDIDEALRFLSEDAFEPTTRDRATVRAQVAPLTFTDEGEKFAAEHDCKARTVAERFQWMEVNYPLPIPRDPIGGWRMRLDGLKAERNLHVGLKKYSNFMKQTEAFREQVFEAAGSLNAGIQAAIDEARGK